MAGNINDYKTEALSGVIGQDIAYIKEIFGNDKIFRSRFIEIGESGTHAALFYFDGMVNSETINQSVVKSLIKADIPSGLIPDYIYVSEKVLFADEVSAVSAVSDMLTAILYGDTLLVIDGSKKALILNTKGWSKRGIDEPKNEKVLKGPREGFNESAMLNLSLIRRKLLTPDLNIEMLRIGRRSSTAVYICYLGALADVKTVERLKKELSLIDIDGVLDSNYIAELLSKRRLPLLNTVGSTERPDIVAGRMLEGRIAVVVDGTPTVLTLPYLFSENFQSDEDYYRSFTLASVGRFLRYVCFALGVAVPAAFIALSNYHLGLLPTSFAIALSRLREGVPMSSFSECLMLIFVFEILKETGMRAAEGQGSALSIVGGLVVGQAAVEAKIISAPVLIAVALSGIAGLMVPRLSSCVFYLKIAMLLASAALGLYGFIAVGCVFLFAVFGMKSFGVDYTVSLKKAGFQQLKDSFIRASWRSMRLRPEFNKNIKRQAKEK